MPSPEEGSDRDGERDHPELTVRTEDWVAEEGVVSPPGRMIDWLTTYGERAGNALIYSSAYLAIIAMVEVAITIVLLSLPPNPAPVVIGLVTFAVYAIDHIVDADADAASKPRRAAFVRRYEDTLYVLASAAYGIAVALSVLGGPIALAITLLPGAFWVLYASDWLPAINSQFQRLKEILLVNTAVVALAWAITLTALPIAFTTAASFPTIGVVFAYFFLRSFVDTEIPNVQDIEGDRGVGVKTLPVVFGVDQTRRALYGIDLSTAMLVGYAGVVGALSLPSAGSLLVGIVYSLGVVSLVGRIEDEELLTIASEFEYPIVGVALALAAGI